jgi:phenylalanyl-tRNA synthetase beta chain
MTFSFQWLATLVDLKDLTPTDIAKALNGAGIEVESVAPLVTATKITTGYVTTCERLAGSDHLSKVQVDTGAHGMRTIVCGAPNIAKGQKVMVALPGAILPEITIKETTIQGVPSQGMICALDELGVNAKFLRSDQVDGIEVLDANTPIGRDQILDDLGLTDVIITLKVLANRPDLWSLEGIAYEVAALVNRPLISIKMTEIVGEQTVPFTIDVQTDKTKQFSIKVLQGIVPTVTPQWLQHRLITSGIRPISFLVDIANYVMLLTGQPLHMYDLKTLPEPKLTLIDTFQNPFVALDEKTYAIQTGDITITSGQHVMCLAGVMGAASCAVTSTTQDVAIEAAMFDPTTIRKTSSRLNLISDASIRFAKGLDMSDYARVLTLTTQLIQSLTQVKTIGKTITISRFHIDPIVISYQTDQINRMLGTTFSGEKIQKALTRFHLQVRSTSQGFEALPPRHRPDLRHPADLAEEVIRLYGFTDLSDTPMPVKVQAGGLSGDQISVRSIKRYLSGQGLDEVLTYTLIEQKLLNEFSFLLKKDPLKLLNPLSEDRQFVRTSILGSLVQTVEYNLARQVADGQIFEIAQVSYPFGRHIELAMVLFGQTYPRGLIRPEPLTFYHGKGLVEGILTLLAIEPNRYQWQPYTLEPNQLHPGRSAGLYIQQQLIAVVGEISPLAKHRFDLAKTPMVVTQINLTALLAIKTGSIKMQTIPRFPIVERDLALYVQQSVSYQQLVKTIRLAGKKLVYDVQLFDLYSGGQVPSGLVSLGLRIQLLDEEKTLEDATIQQVVQAIKTALITDHKVILRS